MRQSVVEPEAAKGVAEAKVAAVAVAATAAAATAATAAAAMAAEALVVAVKEAPSMLHALSSRVLGMFSAWPESAVAEEEAGREQQARD